MITPEEAAQLADNEIASVAARLYKEYERTLRAYQAVDFDDLISLPVRLFDEHPEVRERWQNKLRYLLVDEYQDTNRAQYRLLKLLSGVRGAFTAVGDDDQAIYAWRGADVENLKLLQQDYPKLKVIKLEQNYRSSRRILEAANTVIANNEKLFDKRLCPSTARASRSLLPTAATPSTRRSGWRPRSPRTSSSIAPASRITRSCTAATTRPASSSSTCATTAFLM